MAIFTFVEGGYQNNFRESFFIEMTYLPIRLLVTYTNYFVLARRYLFKGIYIRYVLLTLATIIVAGLIQRSITYYWLYPILFPDWDRGVYWQAYRVVQSVRAEFRSANRTGRPIGAASSPVQLLAGESIQNSCGHWRPDGSVHFQG